MAQLLNLYSYFDYRVYLKDWFASQRTRDESFSLRSFSKKCGILPGPLCSILGGDRALSPKNLIKLSQALELTASESAYFELLRQLHSARKSADRERILMRIKKFRAFERMETEDEDVYQYLSKWYYVAIRELANIKGFRADPSWIGERLRFEVTDAEISDALEFLTRKGFLTLSEDGSAARGQSELKCSDGVFRVALGEFHRSMLGLVSRSLEETSRNLRECHSYTAAIPKHQYKNVKRILENASREIAKLTTGEGKPSDSSVYHMGFFAVPLTQASSKQKEEKDAA